MLLDHIGYYSYGVSGTVLRIIGRIAMPIFAFFIAEGYRKTSSKALYAARLLSFAFISELPFDRYFFGTPFYLGYQNIFFTLFLSLLAIWAYDTVRNRQKSVLMPYIPVALFCIAGEFLNADYGWEGVVTCFLFYRFPLTENSSRIVGVLSMSAVFLLSYTLHGGSFRLIQIFRLAALPLLFIYNGKQTLITSQPLKKIAKYGFYVFYPAHLLLLSLII